MASSELFQPNAKRLSKDKLMAIAVVVEQDVSNAMAKAHKDLKPFLEAK
jgi:hypothetical protein